LLLILFGCLPEVKLGPQTRACAVTFVYVVAVETVYINKCIYIYIYKIIKLLKYIIKLPDSLKNKDPDNIGKTKLHGKTN